MTTTAFPSRVEARRILRVGPLDSDGHRKIELDHGAHVDINKKLLATYTPVAGDYYVVPSDGFPYIATKATFQVTY